MGLEFYFILHKNRFFKVMRKILYITLSAVLIACGGGGGATTPAPAPSPTPTGDTTPPTIVIKGPPTVYHEVGTAYTDEGAEFSDNSGQEPSTSTDIDVDVTTFGTYTVTYSATDAAGNRSTAQRTVEVVGASLIDFYNYSRDVLGVNRANYRNHYRIGMENSIYAQDALKIGDYETANEMVQNAFDAYPLYDNIWRQGAGDFGLNNGDPIGYYSLRMVDKITQVLPLESTGNLTITAVMVLCTNAERPVNLAYDTENVYLELDERMLEDEHKVLKEAIFLFELWMKAITKGFETTTQVHIQEECAETSFNVSNYGYGGSAILSSYANNRDIVSRVPEEIRETTNIWLVITPSGVVGDGSEFGTYWVDGGMGLTDKGLPLIIATDKHFLRKYYMNGTGDYTEVERRVYQPQWFQHEIMHHLYRTWPEYELEITGHDWFERSFWPADFVGIHEPDYYWETIEKRLSGAQPSLAEGLNIVEWKELNIEDIGYEALRGKWLKTNPTNAYHYCEIIEDRGSWYWTNAANVEWPIYEQDGLLLVDTLGVYGIQELLLRGDQEGNLEYVYFNGGEHIKSDWTYQNTNGSNLPAPAPQKNEQHHAEEHSSFKIYHHNHLMHEDTNSID